MESGGSTETLAQSRARAARVVATFDQAAHRADRRLAVMICAVIALVVLGGLGVREWQTVEMRDRRALCRASGRSWHEVSSTRGECWDR